MQGPWRGHPRHGLLAAHPAPPGSVDAGVQTYVDSGAILPPGQILDGGTGGSGKPRSASAGCAMVAPGGGVGALVLVGLPVLGLVRRRRTTRR